LGFMYVLAYFLFHNKFFLEDFGVWVKLIGS